MVMEKMTETSASPDRISSKGGRRSGIDRREFSFTVHVPERRSGRDRRKKDDRRQKSRTFKDFDPDTNDPAPSTTPY